MTSTELAAKWEECMTLFRNNISQPQIDGWFKPITPLSFDGKRLDLHVPSPYIYEHLETHFISIMKPVIRRVFGNGVELFYCYNVIGGEKQSEVKVKTDGSSAAVKPAVTKTANPLEFTSRPDDLPEVDSQLNPRYTFDNYCGSACNNLARSIGEAIANDPTCKTFNPLFIYGPSGVGKTHLMHATGIGIKEHTPSARVLYVTARLFESQYTVATRNGTHNEFIQFYQSIDCLIIDDIQDLIGKEKTQNAFFHIFNHLHLNHKQIILSSDCAPADMHGLPDRLLTRFKWGMTVELERPDLELRMQVLKLRSEQEGISLPDDVMEYIAQNVTGSIREIEGIMVSVMAHATFLSQNISVSLVKSIINHSPATVRRQVNFEMITQNVSGYYKIAPELLFTKTRKREVSDARQMVMYLAKKHINLPFTTIGARLSRTHATVLHGCKSIEERLVFEKQLQEDVAAIEQTFA